MKKKIRLKCQRFIYVTYLFCSHFALFIIYFKYKLACYKDLLRETL